MAENKISRKHFISISSMTGLLQVPAIKMLGRLTGVNDIDNYINAAYRYVDHKNLLNLEFYFIGVTKGTNELRACSGKDSFMIVRLPQQHIAESYFDLCSNEYAVEVVDGDKKKKICGKKFCDPGNVLVAQTRIASYSFLVFKIRFYESAFYKIADEENKLPYEKKESIGSFKINTETLMNWNAPYLHLIAREDRATNNPLFTKDKNINNYPFPYADNANVLKYNPNNFPQLNYRDYKVSKNNPAPFTAIEAPYRLILSPELPNHLYRFKWYFSIPTNEQGDCRNPNPGYYELWMATLTIIPDPVKLDEEKEKKRKKEKKKEVVKDSNEPSITEQNLPMELAIIGSPDYKIPKEGGKPGYDPDQDDSDFNKKSLPTGYDRYQLVRIYSLAPKKLRAKTQKLAFTPLGLCGTIEFRNTLLKEIMRKYPDLNLFQWKQTISFGRDQEVQVVNLVKILVGCVPCNMLHIRSTRRRANRGIAILDYREYLIPQEESKDLLAEQIDASRYNKTTYQCNSPFKSIRFATLKAKEILPLANMKEREFSKIKRTAENEDRLDKMLKKGEGEIAYQEEQEENNLYLGFWAKKPDNSCLEWDFIATDWDGTEHTVTSKLYLISSLLSYAPESNTNFFFPDLKEIEYEKLVNRIKADASTDKIIRVDTLVSTFADTLQKLVDKPGAKVKEWHKILQQSEQYLLEKTGIFRQRLQDINEEIAARIKEYAKLEQFKEMRSAMGDIEESIRNFTSELYQVIAKEKDELNLYIKGFKESVQDIKESAGAEAKQFRDAVLHYSMLPGQYLEGFLEAANAAANAIIADPTERDKVKTKYAELKKRINTYDERIDAFIRSLPKQFRAFINNKDEYLRNRLAEIKQIHCFVEHVESQARSVVNTYKSKITIAANKVEEEINKYKKELQDKLGDKWEEAYKKLEDHYHQANREIASIKTQAIIFKANLRTQLEAGKDKALDFFNYHGVAHQLHSLTGTVQRINDTIHKELPVRLSLAKQYLEHQVGDELLNAAKNPMQVVARFQEESKLAIQTAIREVGHELGGIVNPELASDFISLYHEVKDLDARKKDLDKLGEDIKEQFKKEFEKEFEELKKEMIPVFNGLKDQADAFVNKTKGELEKQFYAKKDKLVLIQKSLEAKAANVKEEISKAIDDKKTELKGYFDTLEAKILGSIKLKDILGIDAETPKYNKTNKSITYKFETDKFKQFGNSDSPFTFLPGSGAKKTTLQCYFEKSLFSSDFTSRTELKDFKVGVFASRLEIDFNKLTLLSNKDVKNKVSVEIGNVGFKKELAFLEALSKNIKIPGTGIILNITPVALIAKYNFTLPGITAGAFTLNNLKFGVGLKIPFPVGGGTLKPIETSFSINQPDDKFVVAVTIFGGRGHFVLTTTPGYVSGVDCGIEFGGYLGLNLGIAKGEAYLMAGIRYVYERDPDGVSTMRFFAYITCGGNITVFGFISISVCFILCLNYEQQGQYSSLFGTASLTLSVKIGFFEKSFTLTFTKRIMGTDKPGVSSEMAYHPLRRPNTNERAELYLTESTGNVFRYAKYENGGNEPPEQDKKGDRIFDECSWEQFCYSFS